MWNVDSRMLDMSEQSRSYVEKGFVQWLIRGILPFCFSISYWSPVLSPSHYLSPISYLFSSAAKATNISFCIAVFSSFVTMGSIYSFASPFFNFFVSTFLQFLCLFLSLIPLALPFFNFFLSSFLQFLCHFLSSILLFLPFFNSFISSFLEFLCLFLSSILLVLPFFNFFVSFFLQFFVSSFLQFLCLFIFLLSLFTSPFFWLLNKKGSRVHSLYINKFVLIQDKTCPPISSKFLTHLYFYSLILLYTGIHVLYIHCTPLLHF